MKTSWKKKKKGQIPVPLQTGPILPPHPVKSQDEAEQGWTQRQAAHQRPRFSPALDRPQLLSGLPMPT